MKRSLMTIRLAKREESFANRSNHQGYLLKSVELDLESSRVGN